MIFRDMSGLQPMASMENGDDGARVAGIHVEKGAISSHVSASFDLAERLRRRAAISVSASALFYGSAVTLSGGWEHFPFPLPEGVRRHSMRRDVH